MFENQGDLKLGLTYAIGDFVSIGARYAPAILYALVLPTGDYGVFAVATAISTVFGIIVVFGLKGAAFKQSFEYADSLAKKSFYGTLWIFIVIAGVVLTLAIDLIWGRFFPNLLGQIEYNPYIRLALWAAYLNSFGIVLYEIYRARTEADRYIVLSVANGLMLAGAAWLFVGMLGYGLLGALFAPLVTGAIWAVIYTVGVLPHISLQFDISKLKKALAYSLPLVPHFVGHWLLNLSDRIILERLVPIGDVGVYGFGYNVGNLQQVVANSGNSVLMPKYGKAQSDGTVRIELPGRFLNYIGWMAAAALAISIFSDEIISILMPPSFAGSAAIVPWVTLGFFCVALYYGPMNGLTLLAGETRWVWLITFAAGAVNIVANIIFVPIFGIQAAAVNTLIGYLTLFILVAFYSKRFDIPRYPWIKIALICLGLVVGVVVDKLSVLETVWEVTTDIVILGLFWTAFVRPLESKAK